MKDGSGLMPMNWKVLCIGKSRPSMPLASKNYMGSLKASSGAFQVLESM